MAQLSLQRKLLPIESELPQISKQNVLGEGLLTPERAPFALIFT